MNMDGSHTRRVCATCVHAFIRPRACVCTGPASPLPFHFLASLVGSASCRAACKAQASYLTSSLPLCTRACSMHTACTCMYVHIPACTYNLHACMRACTYTHTRAHIDAKIDFFPYQPTNQPANPPTTPAKLPTSQPTSPPISPAADCPPTSHPPPPLLPFTYVGGVCSHSCKSGFSERGWPDPGRDCAVPQNHTFLCV